MACYAMAEDKFRCVDTSFRFMRRRPARRQSFIRRSVARPVSLVAFVVAAFVAMQASAHANPFPNNADETFADNGTHTYCYTSGAARAPGGGRQS